MNIQWPLCQLLIGYIIVALNSNTSNDYPKNSMRSNLSVKIPESRRRQNNYLGSC